MSGTVREEDVAREENVDRWSKDLVGGSSALGTTSGFSLGVAEYFLAEFGPLQVHEDQEAAYIISGVGEMTVDGRVYEVSPGTAVSIPPRAPHATRRTGAAPVKLVYAHGAT
ncbi:MAG: cupin domain-containing protein [Planctomycetes bacterium]|nr:cupin domain-containing protein [Planctomycetota bacterium]